MSDCIKYDYIQFDFVKAMPKTKVYRCTNKKSGVALGQVKWYPGWRQYCYFPVCPAIYSNGCLDDIRDFITILMEEHKRENSAKKCKAS